MNAIKTGNTNITMLNKKLVLACPSLGPDVEIKVVNLKRRPDRLAKIKSQLDKNKISFNVFNAIDGKTLNLTNDEKLLFKIPNNFKGLRFDISHENNSGAIGCSISHIKIWEELVKSSKNIFVVLEDDITLELNFKIKLAKIMNDLKKIKLWDIVYIGINDSCFFGKYNDVKIGDNLYKFSKDIRYHGSGTYGYIISKSGASKLLSFLKFGMPQPIDHFMMDYSQKMNVFRAVPLLVSAQIYGETNKDTDIQNNKNKVSI